MNDQQPIETLVLALKSLYSGENKEEKQQAAKYLEEFQKGPDAWSIVHTILSDNSGRFASEVKIFCAQTLRSKIAYDLHQVPENARLPMKDSTIGLLKTSIGGPRIISLHLSIALANLAIQLLSWNNVMAEMINAFGTDTNCIPCLLEFLKVLPEEFNDKRHSNLSDDEYSARSQELVTNNADKVVELLLNYIRNPESTSNRPLVLECLNSWLGEIELQKIVQSDLLEVVFQSLDDINTFEAAIECICSMVKDTREVDESIVMIQQLYPRIINLRPRISQCKDEPDAFQGYTRMFAAAGESWHMLIARSPSEFRPLVESIAECTAYDEDLEVVQYTFYFWYALKQVLVLDKYLEARQQIGDIYLKLISVVIQHLHYPNENGSDLFNGNREEEDKFRAFRHEIGDVLKDCCAVVGASRSLQEAFGILQTALNKQSKKWQDIEAPLFSMRAMAREVGNTENEILPQIMQVLIQLPEHEKIRYAATLVLGRYTEWTAVHPEYLDAQLNYITKGFEFSSKSVISAAAQALMHFCQDCRHLLVGYVEQLHIFYEKVAGELDIESLYQVSDGIAHVVLAQPSDKMLACLQPFCAPVVQKLFEKSKITDLPRGSDKEMELHKSIADEIQILTIFIRVVNPPGLRPNPISPFVIEIYSLVDLILENHGSSTIVAERVSKFIKHCMHSCGMGLEPILGRIAETLANQFTKTQMGCYLWVSGTLICEFSDSSLDASITPAVQESVWQFAYQQMVTFFRHLSTIADVTSIPDLFEDFFLLCQDVIMFYPVQLCTSDILEPTFQSLLVALTLTEYEALRSALHFLQDLFAFSLDKPNHSHSIPYGQDAEKTEQGKRAFQIIILEKDGGQELMNRIISGLIYTFPKDVSMEASALFVNLMEISPQASGLFETWVSGVLDKLPKNSFGEVERRKLLDRCTAASSAGDFRKARTLLKDFCSVYARRNVTPRSNVDGLNLKKGFNFS